MNKRWKYFHFWSRENLFWPRVTLYYPSLLLHSAVLKLKRSPYLAALSKLKPAAAVSSTFDSAMSDRSGASLHVSVRGVAVPSVTSSRSLSVLERKWRNPTRRHKSKEWAQGWVNAQQYTGIDLRWDTDRSEVIDNPSWGTPEVVPEQQVKTAQCTDTEGSPQLLSESCWR